jgi:pimeloyl-ACP methyl ester carboxylesterase
VADPATVPPAEFANTTCRQSPLDLTYQAISGFDLQPQLAGAQTPASIIFGDMDAFGVEWVSQTEAGLPMAAVTSVIVTASGHFPWFEQVAPFEAAFRDFLTAQGLQLGD